MNFENIPEELRQHRQWINWRYEAIAADRKPTKIPLRSHDLYKAAVNDPLDFGSFEAAADKVQREMCHGMGFVFTKADPFTGIDLDSHVTNGTPITPDDRAWQEQIYAGFASYSEWSPSGTGVHIICKGTLSGAGKRRGSVEMYDNLRFFTFTGHRMNAWNCEHRQSAIDYLYEALGPDKKIAATTYVDQPAMRTDLQVWEAASRATNGDKFLRLYNGDWRTDYGLCTSSDGISCNQADFALINILAFYSHNREQIARIFRMSGIAQRPKSQIPRGADDKYVSDMIARAFDRMPSKADVDALHNQRIAILAELGLSA